MLRILNQSEAGRDYSELRISRKESSLGMIQLYALKPTRYDITILVDRDTAIMLAQELLYLTHPNGKFQPVKSDQDGERWEAHR